MQLAQRSVHAAIGKVNLPWLAQRKDRVTALRNDALPHKRVDCNAMGGPDATRRNRKRWSGGFAEVEDATD